MQRLLRLDPPATRDLVIEHDLRVPMPDGAVLLADRWAPRAGGEPLVLADPHLTEIGLAVRRTDGSHRDVMAGSPISVAPLCATPPADFHDPGAETRLYDGFGSGIMERVIDGELVRGPGLDPQQTGYGPGYRIYEGSDGNWFALVLPDDAAWLRLASLPEAASLPATYAPLRPGAADTAARQGETVLEAAFATAPAAEWAARLRGLGLLAEPIEPLDRDAFRRGILDDPVNRQLGRVVSYETADWGHFEQIGPLLQCGPEVGGGPRLMLPGVGEHPAEVLTELGLRGDEVDALLAAKVARQLED
jgi:hypothetical protein